jgi:predicted CDP-diglyceride synthetase/phosphatidate cytidylyltransferase
MKLDLKAFALAGGLFWGLGIFLLTWWLLLTQGMWGRGFLFGKLIGQVYPGYRVSPEGSVIGLLWGLIDGIVASALFGLLYNLLVEQFHPARHGRLR